MRALALALLLLLSGCAGGVHHIAPAAPVAAHVEVVRTPAGWTAAFDLPTAAPAWIFVRSSVTRLGRRPWREPSWTVETPGVRLERRGDYDMLVADAGGPVPARVTIRFTPVGDELLTDSMPALIFSTGAVALFSAQFDLFAMPSLDAADALPPDLSGLDIPYTRTRATFRDEAGPILYAGRRVASVGVDEEEGTYVLFGPAEPVLGGGVATIIDPALPAWLRTELARATPAVLDRYRRELGPRPGLLPVLMVSWAGPTARRTSMRGSTLPDLLAMTFEGEGVTRDNPALRSRALWFVAHESAHFWLGEAVAAQYARDAWITEGGAELLAIRTAGAIDPAFDPRAELQRQVDECARLTAGRSLAGAEARGETEAYPACGVVFGLIAEAAGRRPFGAFVRRAIRAGGADRVLTRAEWLATLTAVSHDPALGAGIARLIDEDVADPAALIASLFERAGVPHRLAGGRIALQ